MVISVSYHHSQCICTYVIKNIDVITDCWKRCGMYRTLHMDHYHDSLTYKCYYTWSNRWNTNKSPESICSTHTHMQTSLHCDLKTSCARNLWHGKQCFLWASNVTNNVLVSTSLLQMCCIGLINCQTIQDFCHLIANHFLSRRSKFKAPQLSRDV